MKPHLEALIGGGWDQLYALMMIVVAVSGSVTTATLYFLRYRLRSFFVTLADHNDFRDTLKVEHSQNQERFDAIEENAKDLATMHKVNGVLQRQDALAEQVSKLQVGAAKMEGTVGGIADGIGRVEHQVSMVLNHMLERDKA
jgi:hypothetical protein